MPVHGGPFAQLPDGALRTERGAYVAVRGPVRPIRYHTGRRRLVLTSSRCNGVERLANPEWREHLRRRLLAQGFAVEP